jgi:hypothetical protein
VPAATLIALALLTGCERRVPVTGRVVENGQPLAGAELRWAHRSDPNVFVTGVTDATGAYVLDAAGRKDIPAGTYEVTVTWWRTKDGQPLPAGEQGTAMKGTAAARPFTATVEVEVKAGSPTVDIDVTGKVTPVEGG